MTQHKYKLTLKNEEGEKLKIDIVDGTWEIKPNEPPLTEFVGKSNQIAKLSELIPQIRSLLAMNGLKTIELDECEEDE